MRVAVVGAGPSGLVALKYLKTAHQFFPVKPIEAQLFESEAVIGGTFSHRAYEDTEVCTFRKEREREKKEKEKKKKTRVAKDKNPTLPTRS